MSARRTVIACATRPNSCWKRGEPVFPLQICPEPPRPDMLEEAYFLQDTIAEAMGAIGRWKIGVPNRRRLRSSAYAPVGGISHSGDTRGEAHRRLRGLEPEIRLSLWPWLASRDWVTTGSWTGNHDSGETITLAGTLRALRPCLNSLQLTGLCTSYAFVTSTVANGHSPRMRERTRNIAAPDIATAAAYENSRIA